MKSLSEILLEKLKVTKSEPGDCTLEEFLVWYYFDNTKTIEDLTFEEFTKEPAEKAAAKSDKKADVKSETKADEKAEE